MSKGAIEALKERLISTVAENDAKTEQLQQLGDMLVTSGAGVPEGLTLELLMEKFTEQQTAKEEPKRL